MEKTIEQLFGLKGNKMKVKVDENPVDPNRVPDIDPDYVFAAPVLSRVHAWYNFDLNSGLYLFGPTGSGKSSMVREYFGRLGKSVYEFHGTPDREARDLVGGFTLQGGDTVWIDGPLTAAARLGAILLIDELDTLSPGTGMVLKAVLDGGPVAIPELNEYVMPAEGFRIVATGNTSGNGDRFGRYRSTSRQNIALLNCFARTRIDYMEEDAEVELVKKTGLPEAIAHTFVGIANDIRSLFLGTDDAPPSIDTTMSTRDLLRVCGYFKVFSLRPNGNLEKNLTDALDMSIGTDDPAITKAIQEILQRKLGN